MSKKFHSHSFLLCSIIFVCLFFSGATIFCSAEKTYKYNLFRTNFDVGVDIDTLKYRKNNRGLSITIKRADKNKNPYDYDSVDIAFSNGLSDKQKIKLIRLYSKATGASSSFSFNFNRKDLPDEK